MKINIISVGKLQQDFRTLFNSYKKKISFYAELNEIEIKEVNHDNKEVQIKKETEAILNKVPKNSMVFLCSLKGKQYSSEEFSDFFNKDNITFVIGGSHGVDEKLFTNKISFSRSTLPHQLFKVVLVEQIFRALSIKNGSKYHK